MATFIYNTHTFKKDGRSHYISVDMEEVQFLLKSKQEAFNQYP